MCDVHNTSSTCCFVVMCNAKHIWRSCQEIVVFGTLPVASHQRCLTDTHWQLPCGLSSHRGRLRAVMCPWAMQSQLGMWAPHHAHNLDRCPKSDPPEPVPNWSKQVRAVRHCASPTSSHKGRRACNLHGDPGRA